MTPDDKLSEIEKAFYQSWDKIENFYATNISENGWVMLKPLLELILELRKRGYDKQFRAGQSMFTFIISRAEEWGLRPGQPNIEFQQNEKGGITVVYKSQTAPAMVDLDPVEFTPALEALLVHLSNEPIY